jgi:hypothetical protein
LNIISVILSLDHNLILQTHFFKNGGGDLNRGPLIPPYQLSNNVPHKLVWAQCKPSSTSLSLTRIWQDLIEASSPSRSIWREDECVCVCVCERERGLSPDKSLFWNSFVLIDELYWGWLSQDMLVRDQNKSVKLLRNWPCLARADHVYLNIVYPVLPWHCKSSKKVTIDTFGSMFLGTGESVLYCIIKTQYFK